MIVTFKDAVLEASSPVRHDAELHSLLKCNYAQILFLYTDGGPDHCLVYIISVQLSFLALFLNLDLDFCVLVVQHPVTLA